MMCRPADVSRGIIDELLVDVLVDQRINDGRVQTEMISFIL